jgi:hypothetical protein
VGCRLFGRANTRLYYCHQQFLGERTAVGRRAGDDWQYYVPLHRSRPPHWKVGTLPPPRRLHVSIPIIRIPLLHPRCKHAVRSFWRSSLCLLGSRRFVPKNFARRRSFPGTTSPSARTTPPRAGWKLAGHFCFAPLRWHSTLAGRSAPCTCL